MKRVWLFLIIVIVLSISGCSPNNKEPDYNGYIVDQNENETDQVYVIVWGTTKEDVLTKHPEFIYAEVKDNILVLLYEGESKYNIGDKVFVWTEEKMDENHVAKAKKIELDTSDEQ
ncbi:DUF3221 domain-containing protein [Caldalkalibacillus mannanilyticus]|uniref:DUF3221 domain-containing protein n=1 Tax=Caldalkalibacillus mannanilyticus TaxID=1418 RepID=UPI00046936DE|nr:DUF3221 domain-containing protein [Caldalkalibacillus mannanilyticus]